MNIWIINEYAGSPYHGMEFRHYYLGKEFLKQGHNVTIISASYSHLFRNPRSMTLHRWDITENNMLRLKVEKAAFTRCIAKDGQKEVLSIVGKKYHNKIKVLYMGIFIPKKLPEINQKPQKIFVITCPANFVPKKGHKFLIEACSLLVKRGLRDFQCLLIGDGPIKDSLRDYAVSLEVEHIVKFLGLLPHENLLKMYENGEVNVVVLPSIITDDGEKEGIPVALMEAMAYGIPVISTNTGGIPELLEGAGIIVSEKDSVSLANAIEKCIIDREYAYKLGLLGREKVMSEFNIEKNVKKLIEEMKKY